MRSAEHTGCAEDPQPSRIALPMKPYQLQAIRWMRQMEGRNLNDLFWEKRAFADGGEYWFAPDLGECRLEEPATASGGLLCDEMGMGKTVELLGLVCAAPATVEQLKAPGLAKNHNEEGPLVASRATLIVVPPALVSQWVNEITKSIVASNPLSVKVFVTDKEREAPIAPREIAEEVRGVLRRPEKGSVELADHDIVDRHLQHDAGRRPVCWAGGDVNPIEQIQRTRVAVEFTVRQAGLEVLFIIGSLDAARGAWRPRTRRFRRFTEFRTSASSSTRCRWSLAEHDRRGDVCRVHVALDGQRHAAHAGHPGPERGAALPRRAAVLALGRDGRLLEPLRPEALERAGPRRARKIGTFTETGSPPAVQGPGLGVGSAEGRPILELPARGDRVVAVDLEDGSSEQLALRAIDAARGRRRRCDASVDDGHVARGEPRPEPPQAAVPRGAAPVVQWLRRAGQGPGYTGRRAHGLSALPEVCRIYDQRCRDARSRSGQGSGAGALAYSPPLMTPGDAIAHGAAMGPGRAAPGPGRAGPARERRARGPHRRRPRELRGPRERQLPRAGHGRQFSSFDIDAAPPRDRLLRRGPRGVAPPVPGRRTLGLFMVDPAQARARGGRRRRAPRGRRRRLHGRPARVRREAPAPRHR